MSRSSVLQPLGGPLAGHAFEFPGHDVVVGSAPDCEVRIDGAGVHPYHARIVISEAGVTLFGIEGVVGINDDKVLGEGRLESGDFVWIGEPGAEGSLMFQFTLGSDALPGGSAEADSDVVHEMMEELEPQDLSFDAVDAQPFVAPESLDEMVIGEPSPELDLLDIEPEPAAFAPMPLPDPYAEPAPPAAPVMPPPKSTSASGAFKPPAPWQTASTPAEAPAEVEYASAWESKPVAPEPEPIEEAPEEIEEPEPAPAPPPPPPPPARPTAPAVPPARRQNTSPNLRAKSKAAPEVDLASLVPPHPQRPDRTTSSTGVVVGGLITLILLGVGISWVVNSTPPIDAPPDVPGSVVMPPRKPAEPTAPVNAAPAAPPTVASLLDEAAAAAATGEVAKAGQLLAQAAQMEPANADVAARRAEIDARLAILAKMFSPGPTTFVAGRTTRVIDPAAKTDLAAQIRCGVTPASIEPGVAYTVRCSIVNIGQKPFRLESVTATETADGARSEISGTAPPQDLAPQGEAMILEKAGAWAAKSQWSLDVTAKTGRAESFVVNHSWR